MQNKKPSSAQAYFGNLGQILSTKLDDFYYFMEQLFLTYLVIPASCSLLKATAEVAMEQMSGLYFQSQVIRFTSFSREAFLILFISIMTEQISCPETLPCSASRLTL